MSTNKQEVKEKFNDKLTVLVRNIAKGNLSKQNIYNELNELDKLESEYGYELFGHYTPEKKEKPWDLTYLKELENLFFLGAFSREFIEHMAEVSEEVYKAKKTKSVLSVGIAAFVVILVLIAIQCLRR